MMFPLVRELAAQEHPVRVPVTVTCRVLKLCRQQYYRWLAEPVSDAELDEAWIANVSHPGSDGDSGYWFPIPVGVVCWSA